MRFLAVLALCAVAAPAVAQDAQPAPVKEKKICRRSNAPATGSIMAAKPVCHTATEWASIEKANKKNTEDLMERNRATGGLLRE